MINHKIKFTDRYDSHGFSLLELIVVIALVGILAGIGMPYYQNFIIGLQLRGAARDVTSDLRYAQQQAVTTQINYRVVFSVNANNYQVENDSTGDLIKAVNIKSPVTIQSTTLASSTVVFNATGAATSFGNVVLSTSNRTATIDIKPSGYAQISLSQ